MGIHKHGRDTAESRVRVAGSIVTVEAAGRVLLKEPAGAIQSAAFTNVTLRHLDTRTSLSRTLSALENSFPRWPGPRRLLSSALGESRLAHQDGTLK